MVSMLVVSSRGARSGSGGVTEAQFAPGCKFKNLKIEVCEHGLLVGLAITPRLNKRA